MMTSRKIGRQVLRGSNTTQRPERQEGCQYSKIIKAGWTMLPFYMTLHHASAYAIAKKMFQS
jgi:hypothetical protein